MRQHIGVYIQNGLSPSPRIDLKFKSQSEESANARLKDLQDEVAQLEAEIEQLQVAPSNFRSQRAQDNIHNEGVAFEFASKACDELSKSGAEFTQQQ